MKDKNINKDKWTQHLQLGFEISAYVVIFFFIGYLLDNYFNSRPYLTLVGIFFAIVSVFYVIWKRFLR
ncbi:MAG: AtpZ/AtpI family protein [Elusimicrobiota bacterium]